MVTRAEQSKATAERNRRKVESARLQSEQHEKDLLEKRIADYVVKHKPLWLETIDQASDQGHYQVHVFSYDNDSNDSFGPRVMKIASEYLKKLGYEVTYETESGNHGDSAAPCFYSTSYLIAKWCS